MDCFNIDSEPSSEPPYGVAKETDPARIVVDSLIREGIPSTKSYSYRNLSEVTARLDNPDKKWDPHLSNISPTFTQPNSIEDSLNVTSAHSDDQTQTQAVINSPPPLSSKASTWKETW